MKYLIISMCLFLLSCSEIYRFLDQTNRPREVVTDKRVMTYSSSKNKFTKTATKGPIYPDTLSLIPGKIYKISPDVPYVLDIQEIDFSVYTLYSNYNEKDHYVELGIIRPTSNKIKLDSCTVF